MAKAKSKSGPRARSQKTTRSTTSKVTKGAPQTSSPHGSATKHDQVLAMLRLNSGATIAAMVQATRWQPHSVRGFLAGVVKKKLGLNLASEKTKSGRVYRVATTKPQTASRSKIKPGKAHG